ncbi:serine hydrolase domain-containing protein [Dokdonella sp. MW10]|uniref:serine hydrolase domain-containing protein n=1 Tax=Dokdonella sp. MW10 TaxID=2992926 RepID=UPI003F7F0B07
MAALATIFAGSGDVAAATKKPTRKAKVAAVATPLVVPQLVNPAAIAKDPAPIATEFAKWLDQLEQSDKVSGLAVAIVKDDDVLLERGIGYADWQKREPVDTGTVFRLASLSKAFATTLAGMLVEDGVLSWNTRIAEMLPTFALADVDGSQKLTVRDILSHRVGLPHNTYDRLIEQDEPYPVLVERLREVPMTCAVGDCYGYQNIAFSLIGDVTYAATGDFFYHQVEKRVFHPLGMTTATYGRDALENSPRWARPHRRAGKSWQSFQPNERYYHMPPAAGVNASIVDMRKWLVAQMGGEPSVLAPALLDETHAPIVATPREKTSTPWRKGRLLDAQYALGWRIYDYAGEPMVFHAGAVQGYRALIAFLPERRFGMVMLWNCESAAPYGLMPMLFDRYLGLPRVDWADIGDTDESASTGGD